MMMDVFLRNPGRIEHRLAGGIIFCCLMMFMEEFVRHYLPIAYSPLITVTWFSTSGIMITGLGLHLFVKLARFEHKFPKYVYPYLFYIPVVLVLLNLIFNDQMISGNEFHQVGIWKLPVYNTAYYAAMIGANLYNVLYIIILMKGKKHAVTREQSGIYNQLMAGVIVTAFFNLVIGTIDFKGYMPPYPYIYGTVLWCILLRHTMLKYDFLNYVDKRYERLFNLSPAAILLVDLQGNIKEANPSAKQMFHDLGLDHANVFSLLGDEIKARIAAREAIKNSEITIAGGDRQRDVLVDGDYVMVEYEPYLILIVRDITKQKEDQRKIAYLAYHDTLTHLPNRRYFYEKFDEILLEATRSGKKLAVAIIDLDGFKEINDKYGHLIGDQALLHLAEHIRSVFHPPDLAVRLGGDEFAVLFPSVDSKAPLDEKFARLRAMLEANKLIVENDAITIHLSIGVSFYPDHGHDRVALMRSADQALYYVKRHGRNKLSFGGETD